MTVVIGTAGHIDHGKTTLLRALTGIDADRLPEERRRGMTIDVGYAHLALDDGSELDFVDVPGHDRLVGNMLVGAGEIDAALLVVGADDGIRPQTTEHLALLDALGIADGVAVVTKIDTVDDERVRTVIDAVRDALASTTLAGSPVLGVASLAGEGIPELRAALVDVRDRVTAGRGHHDGGPARLPIDRVFGVKGRGVVVTGTLRGERLARGDVLRVVPGDGSVRVREVQVHGREVDAAPPGRTAVNLAGDGVDILRRGVVLTADARILGTSRVLVQLGRPLADRSHSRLHLGTAAVDATVGRGGRDAIDLAEGAIAILRLAEPIAAAPGDRFVLRRSAGAVGDTIVGGLVLDASPPRGVSRRRQTSERVGAVAAAVASGHADAVAIARLALHGSLARGSQVDLSPDVAEVAAATAMDLVGAGTPVSLPVAREAIAKALRRRVTVSRASATTAAREVIDDLVASGRLARAGDRLHVPGSVVAAPDPAELAAMDRLEAALAVPAPPSLAAAARAAGCPASGVRELERSGRIVVIEPDLAYAMSTYRDLAARALAMAAANPLTPAALRDATGTSRKFVMAILEDLDRRGILRRTPEGHVPGPRAPRGAVVT